MIKSRQFLLLLLFLSLTWISCEQERDPCLQPRTVAAHILFKKAVESDTGVIVGDSTLPKAIIGVADSPYALVYAEKRSDLFLVLSPLVDSTRIFIIPDSAKQTKFDIDTVTFYYVRRLSFISTPCGYTHHYLLTGLRHTTNNIDSALITADDVNGNANTRHVSIYY